MSPENFATFRQMQEKKDKEIEKILSAEQKEKYKQVKTRMFEKPRWPIPPA